MKRKKDFVYQCKRCGARYDPQEANQRGYYCHGVPMERVWVRDGGNGNISLTVPDGDSDDWAVRRILPPPENEIGPEAVEQLLGSLHGVPGVLSLEIAGDNLERQLLVRGAPSAVQVAAHQLQAAYGQVSWEDPGDDDPALRLLNTDPGSDVYVSHRQAELRRPVFFPIKTWRDFEDADPLRVLLGAFRGLRDGELLFSQLVLQKPAPDSWADAYQGSAREMDFRMKAASPTGQARAGLFAAGIILGTIDLGALCAAGGAFMRPGAGVMDALKTLGGLGVLGAINVGLVILGLRWWRRLSTRLNADPSVIQRKVSLPAFRCALRMWAVAETPERADYLTRRLLNAYRLYNLAEGNAFVTGDALDGDGTAPHVLEGASTNPGIPRSLGDVSQMMGRENGLVMNLAELAGLWHMPVGDALELVQREEHERHVPLPEDVAEGVWIGKSIKDDQTSVRVHLSRDAVKRNILLMGKTQMGKSNVMEIIARAGMQDRDKAIVVLDPQGDMVRHLRGMIPPDRVHETYYLDFADQQRIIGLNLLDMSTGLTIDKVVGDLIGLGEALWSKFWGPRMEATWRYATRSLALINQELVAQGKTGEQYTLLDVPALLLSPQNRRQNFLANNLPLDTPDGQDAYWWWNVYFEDLRSSHQQDVISPVLTKVFRVAGNRVSRLVFGQSASTLNVRRVLEEGGILLVHTANGMLGPEVGGFIGGVFLNLLNLVIRERAEKSRSNRAPCMAIIDEFQAIPAVDYGALLSELQKFEVGFTLGTQSLARLRAIDREMPGITLAGVTTVMCFQTNNEDAEYMSGELDGLKPSNLVNLEKFHAYVKTTEASGKRLPVYSLKTRPSKSPDAGVAAKVLGRVNGYTSVAAKAQRDVMRLADLLGADPESKDRGERVLSGLQEREERQFISTQQLSKMARMMATTSTQDFAGTAGNIARGVSAKGNRKTKDERKRQAPGFRALDAQ